MSEYRLYLFMNTSMLSMTTGRIAAQACHAGNRFTANFNYRVDDYQKFPTEYKSRQSDAELIEAYLAWCSSTPQDFGTTIVINGFNLGRIKEMLSGQPIWNGSTATGTCQNKPISKIFLHPFFFETITDPCYFVRDGSTVHNVLNVETCSYLFCSMDDWKALNTYLQEHHRFNLL